MDFHSSPLSLLWGGPLALQPTLPVTWDLVLHMHCSLYQTKVCMMMMVWRVHDDGDDDDDDDDGVWCPR